MDARVADARGCEKKSHDSGAAEVQGYLAMLVGGSIARDRNVLTRSGKGLVVNAYDWMSPGRLGGSLPGIAPPRLPQIRACPIKAPGSSCHLFATRRHTEWIAIAAGSGLCFRNRANRSHVIRRPRPRRDSQCCQSQVAPLRNRDNILELPVIP